MLEQFQYEQKPDCRLIHEWKPKSSARDEFSRHWVNKKRSGLRRDGGGTGVGMTLEARGLP